jgi:2-polyprenyl-6-methoxyphenol hydroxylase-like FAD-dependent oxidoreductase
VVTLNTQLSELDGEEWTAVTLTTVPRYDGDRISKRQGRAVVVGAGMSGLLSARVLADGFDEVTVVDRDPLPDEPVARRGVPQSHHLHVLLEAGHATLEDLFPGYGEELLADGGLVIDGACDVDFYDGGDFLADGPRRIPLYCATRPLYEQLVRRRVADHDGVDLRPGCRSVDYLTDDAATTVDGVVVDREASTREELPADLVVDATGRTSRTPAWLDEHGYASPSVDEVHIDLSYSTAFFRRPDGDRRSFVVQPSPPHTRGGAVLPVEDGRWLVTLFGFHGDRPPTDAEGFAEFAASLPVPHPKRIVDGHARTSEGIVHYPFPSEVRRRYEDLDRFPAGLVVVGDAIASFNPIYAQGMSVAALEALILHSVLPTDRDDLAPRFFRRAAETVDIAWNMAVGADFRFSRTRGPKPRGTDVSSLYLSRLVRRAHTDSVLSDAFFRVMMMERPPSSLLRPGVAWRVLGPAG